MPVFIDKSFQDYMSKVPTTISPETINQIQNLQMQNSGVVGCGGVDVKCKAPLNGQIFEAPKPNVTTTGKGVPTGFFEKLDNLSTTTKVLLAAAVILVAFVVFKPFSA